LKALVNCAEKSTLSRSFTRKVCLSVTGMRENNRCLDALYPAEISQLRPVFL
jgi:hypothetical protein